jgi:hypothetical protein
VCDRKASANRETVQCAVLIPLAVMQISCLYPVVETRYRGCRDECSSDPWGTARVSMDVSGLMGKALLIAAAATSVGRHKVATLLC